MSNGKLSHLEQELVRPTCITLQKYKLRVTSPALRTFKTFAYRGILYELKWRSSDSTQSSCDARPSLHQCAHVITPPVEARCWRVAVASLSVPRVTAPPRTNFLLKEELTVKRSTRKLSCLGSLLKHCAL